MDVPHFTLSDNYAPGIPYQKQEENTHLVKPGTFLTPFLISFFTYRGRFFCFDWDTDIQDDPGGIEWGGIIPFGGLIADFKSV